MKSNKGLTEFIFYTVNIDLIKVNYAGKRKDSFESFTERQMPTIKSQELPKFIQFLALARIKL